MSNIKEEIEKLQYRDKLIDYAKSIFDSELDSVFLKTFTGDNAVKLEITKIVKQYLQKYAFSLENEIDFTSVLSFTADDLIFLKTFVEKLKNKQLNISKTQPISKNIKTDPPKKIKAIFEKVDENQNIISDSTSHFAKTPSQTQAMVAETFPRPAILPDISVVTDLHGKIDGLNYDHPIIVTGYHDKDNYSCCLADNPGVVFPAPILSVVF